MPAPRATFLLGFLLSVLVGLGLIILAVKLPLYLRIQTAPTVPSTITKQFTWTPPDNFPPGSYKAQIVAEDDAGGRTTREVEIVVEAPGEGEVLPGDLNRDGVVNIDDLTLVTSNFGRTASEASDQRADANADGIINIDDLNIVTSNFGRERISSGAFSVVDTNRDGTLTAEELTAALRRLTAAWGKKTGEAGFDTPLDFDQSGVISGNDLDEILRLVSSMSTPEQRRLKAFQTIDQNQDYTLTAAEMINALRGFRAALGKKEGDEGFDPKYDFNNSGGVAVNDLAFIRELRPQLAELEQRQLRAFEAIDKIIDQTNDYTLTAAEWQAGSAEFTSLLNQGQYKEAYDLNGDGKLNGLDVDFFSQLAQFVSA